MKIRTKEKTYGQVCAIKPYVAGKPIKQWAILRIVVLLLSVIDTIRVGFTYKKVNMELVGKKDPCLIIMNHSSFLDLKIIGRIFWNRPYQIVCTIDAMMGKSWLMKLLGCIPTKKFTTEPKLIRDMLYCVRELKSYVVMYPEAGYSIDGTATVLPDSVGKCIKLMKVPVVMVKSHGAFFRQPLYNNLRIRKVKVHADVECILTVDDIEEKSASEINEIIAEQFSFDHFKWQQENKVSIAYKHRAEGLNRVMYKCAGCLEEGKMLGEGVNITCGSCGKKYELTEYGQLKALNGNTAINHIPDWCKWERECVRKELSEGTYCIDVLVDIYVMTDTRAIYYIGEGRLIHSMEGFELESIDGELKYRQGAEKAYTINADFYWYEKGDVVCIGEKQMQYYCLPKKDKDVVFKMRLAAEEMYKIKKGKGINSATKNHCEK